MAVLQDLELVEQGEHDRVRASKAYLQNTEKKPQFHLISRKESKKERKIKKELTNGKNIRVDKIGKSIFFNLKSNK